MFNFEDYRKILAEKRKGEGMSQAQLAKEAGISRNFLSEIEGGKKKPSIETVEKINNVIPIIFYSNSRQ